MTTQFNQDKYYSLETTGAVNKNTDKEVAECLEFAVAEIYKKATANSLNKQLKRVVLDMYEIEQKSKSAAHTVRLAIIMYPSSYRLIAKEKGVSHVAIYNQLKNLAVKYDWIKQIFEIMRG